MAGATRRMFNTLYIKLSSALVLLFLVIGIALVLLTRYSSERYYQEVTQRLNAPIAMYVAGEAPLIRDGVVNESALQALAHQAMIINPSVEVYLLDREGRVLTHDLGDGAQVSERVDLTPVKRFLAGAQDLPLTGDDPRVPERRKIFAAAEVRNAERVEGYVYIVLGGQKYEQLATSAEVNDVLRLSSAAVIGCVIFGLGSALLIFARLSRRLKALTARVNDFCRDSIGACAAEGAPAGDEIAQLSLAFDAMQTRIDEQLEQIQNDDRQRRELLTNISHDLRTPLATMQGYLDTLLLQRQALSPARQHEYLGVARNHGARLNRLVDDLFELARLDSDAIAPRRDRFCIAELLVDIAQEHQLAAQQRAITLRVQRNVDDATVWADIGLIERVLVNLVANALRHTPRGGEVVLTLTGQRDLVRVQVADTGAGIARQDLPAIFDRYFHVDTTGGDRAQSTGLGLAIVKRILELHAADISVRSRVGEGTVFSFGLPRAVASPVRPEICEAV